MNDLIQKNAQTIAKTISCPKHFSCSSNGFAIILQSRRYLQDYFTCIGAVPDCCPHSLHYGYECYCMCPLLNYVARELFKERAAFAPKVSP
jgi:hypothetical protein